MVGAQHLHCRPVPKGTDCTDISAAGNDYADLVLANEIELLIVPFDWLYIDPSSTLRSLAKDYAYSAGHGKRNVLLWANRLRPIACQRCSQAEALFPGLGTDPCDERSEMIYEQGWKPNMRRHAKRGESPAHHEATAYEVRVAIDSPENRERGSGAARR